MLQELWNRVVGRKQSVAEAGVDGLFISHPKSGRTWLRIMLDDLGIRLRYTHAGASLAQALLPEQIPDPAKLLGRQKIVFMHRDPRDVLVSCYFQATKRLGVFEGNLSDFLHDPRRGLGKITAFNDIWLAAVRGRDDVCVVTYEKMHADVTGELRRIAGFLGKSPEFLDLTRAAEVGRFDQMQKKEAGGVYEGRYSGVLTPGDRQDPESFKVRRGVIGGYVDYLSGEDIAYCDAVMAKYQGGN